MSREKDAEQAGKTLARLEQMGVKYVVLQFSGGHDEGSVEYAELLGPVKEGAPAEPVDEETRLREAPRRHERMEFDQREVWSLVDPLEFPVYAAYGSFAGECSIYGTVTWDVAARRAVLSAEETVWEEQPSLTFEAVDSPRAESFEVAS